MADEELRALARAAEDQGDAPSWERLARASLRSGERDAAARAVLFARARGAKDGTLDDIEDALAPTSLDEFSIRKVGSGLGPIWKVAWSADGKTVYGVEDGRIVLAFEGHGRRRVAALEDAVETIATDLAGRRLTVARAVGRKRHPLALLDLEAGTLGPSIDRGTGPVSELAFWGESDLVFVARGGSLVRGFRFDASGAPVGDDALWAEIGGNVTLTSTGGVAKWRRGLLDLYEPLAKSPCGVVEVNSRLGGVKVLVGGDLLVMSWAQPRSARTFRAIRRVMTVDWGWLLGPRKEEDHDDRNREWPRCAVVPSPSGRQLACVFDAEPDVVLIDVLAFKARTLALGSLARCAEWSPSGRSLAVGTNEGLVFIEA